MLVGLSGKLSYKGFGKLTGWFSGLKASWNAKHAKTTVATV